jgi:hypothetical protein
MEKVTIDILGYHASPIQAAQIAKNASVGQMFVLTTPLVKTA